MTRPIGMIAAIAATTLCACSPKDAAKPDSAKVAQAAAPAAAPASRGAFDAATHIATIYTKDFSFEAPDSIAAGWTTFHLVNDGPALHHVQLVRLDSGKTAQELDAAMKNPGPPPSWAAFVGGPNAPSPGGQINATFNLAAGNYVLLCMVDLPDHIPHAAKGMVKPLTVIAATGAPAAEPASDVSVALTDYAFTVQGTLASGKHTIKIVNNGPQLHEFELVRLAPGKKAADVLAWIAKPDGPPPGDAIGGVVALSPSGSGYVTVDLAAGDYAFLCFLPDAKDGKPHFAHGMMKEIKIS